jgi:hypothetical protein
LAQVASFNLVAHAAVKLLENPPITVVNAEVTMNPQDHLSLHPSIVSRLPSCKVYSYWITMKAKIVQSGAMCIPHVQLHALIRLLHVLGCVISRHA